MAAIDVNGLTYTYPGSPAPALKDVLFQVEAGQMVAVVGANGAGKSTLCLALAGLIPALYHGQMQGTVRVDGLDTRQHGQVSSRDASAWCCRIQPTTFLGCATRSTKKWPLASKTWGCPEWQCQTGSNAPSSR